MRNMERELLEQHGFDVNGAMKRFLNNEQLYIKCLKKFLTDESMNSLKAAFVAGNAEDGFKAAHTMKGFVANLGMEKLHQALNPVVEKLRAGSVPEQDELNGIEEIYKEMYELIENI